MPTLTINAPALHSGQHTARVHPARFKVMACGRRWGKTRYGSVMCLETAVNGGRAWWVAPSYKMANVGWRLVNRLSVQIPGVVVNKADRLITFPTGGEIAIRSADNPDSLRGEGLDLAVMDECAFMKESAWTEALRPALSDRKGKAIFISTPKGRNWFWRLYQQGVDGRHDTMAWQLPTTDNPYIDDSEIEAARRSLPERIFQQEYLAMFLDDAGGVFRRVMECATSEPVGKAEPGRQYVAGVDVAAQVDYTAVCVMDVADKRQVHLDRFNRVEYPVLEERLAAIYGRYNLTTMVIESNSIGRPVIDHLRQRGLSIQEFTTTNATKTAVIQSLQSAFEHGEVAILNDPVQVGELQAFEGEQMSTHWRYSAPEGMHDDTVMAMAIAWSALAKHSPMSKDQPTANSKWQGAGMTPAADGSRWKKL